MISRVNILQKYLEGVVNINRSDSSIKVLCNIRICTCKCGIPNSSKKGFHRCNGCGDEWIVN